MRWFRFAAGCLMALLASTALPALAEEPPKPLSITNERNAASGFALTQAGFYSRLVSNCKRLPERGKVDPDEAITSWRKRNGEMLEAAQGWFLYVKGVIARRENAEAANTFEHKTVGDLSKQADDMLKQAFGRPEPKAQICDSWMRALDDPRIDLTASKDYGQPLTEILAFHRLVVRQGADAKPAQ